MESSYTPAYNFDYAQSEPDELVLLAFLTGTESAQATVRELWALGIHAQDISVLSGDREPVDEPDLPATEPDSVPDQLPIVTDYEVPPDEPLGGSDRLGIPRKDEREEDEKRDA